MKARPSSRDRQVGAWKGGPRDINRIGQIFWLEFAEISDEVAMCCAIPKKMREKPLLHRRYVIRPDDFDAALLEALAG